MGILYEDLLICFFLLCLSWLLCSRLRKFRRDLWITLYIYFISILRFYTYRLMMIIHKDQNIGYVKILCEIEGIW